MGHKKLCLDCKLSLNRDFDPGSGLKYPCPNCGKTMLLLPHRFRPPKKNDEKGWNLVQFLIENGFRYQHIFENGIELREHYNRKIKYVQYPDNIRDAKEFIEKYKSQAIKSNT
ncbi:MAG: hypothetical protein INR69_13005 [Mucilaginibacter polytrichastri]|nr:hypothetical protein [Mucilaginibacter polytrichastri]